MLVRLSSRYLISITYVLTLDTFLTLNAIRILTIIALLLVFASNTLTLANDIKAVNQFASAGNNNSSSTTNSTSGATNATIQDSDYILFVTLKPPHFFNVIQLSSLVKIIQGKHCTEPTCRPVLGSSQSAFYHISSHRAHPLRDRFPILVVCPLFPHTGEKLWPGPIRSYSDAVSNISSHLSLFL